MWECRPLSCNIGWCWSQNRQAQSCEKNSGAVKSSWSLEVQCHVWTNETISVFGWHRSKTKVMAWLVTGCCLSRNHTFRAPFKVVFGMERLKTLYFAAHKTCTLSVEISFNRLRYCGCLGVTIHGDIVNSQLHIARVIVSSGANKQISDSSLWLRCTSNRTTLAPATPQKEPTPRTHIPTCSRV